MARRYFSIYARVSIIIGKCIGGGITQIAIVDPGRIAVDLSVSDRRSCRSQ